MPGSIIGHIDMDAFFAAVEERGNPSLKGLPLVVGSDPKEGKGRGVVATANYPARAYGIRSALPITRAWAASENARKKGLPAVHFLPPDFKKYSRASKNIMAMVRSNAPLIEQMGGDEAYFDLTFTGAYQAAAKLCKEIKHEIFQKEQLTCSMGIGPNKLIAKIASDFKKPDGLVVVNQEDAARFIAPLPIRVIPGIGPKTAEKLHARGIIVVKDMQRFSRQELQTQFGKWGAALYHRVRGHGSAVLQETRIAKSVGEQRTFARDTKEVTVICATIKDMINDIIMRLGKGGKRQFRTVVITVRFADFFTQTRSHTLLEPSHSKRILFVVALKLLMPFLDARSNPKQQLIRMVGVRVEKLN